MTFEEFWTNGGVSTFTERTRFDLQNLKNKDEVELNEPAQCCPLSTRDVRAGRGWGGVGVRASRAKGYLERIVCGFYPPVGGAPSAQAGNKRPQWKHSKE